jgi:hypothetical protein
MGLPANIDQEKRDEKGTSLRRSRRTSGTATWTAIHAAAASVHDLIAAPMDAPARSAFQPIVRKQLELQRDFVAEKLRPELPIG